MNWRTSFRRPAALVATAALAFSAHAQDGAYDWTFGDVGRTWIDVTSANYDTATKLIRLPGGDLFMAGACGSSYVACAAWLTPAGTLASGFGPSGNGTAPFSDFAGWPGDGGSVGDVAAFADGRVAILAQNNSGGGAYMALLRANGTELDPSVGNGAGYVIPAFPARLLRVTPQQKVIVVGVTSTAPSAIVVARYDGTFHLDTSFGSGGTSTLAFPGESFTPRGMTLQKDGKIVVIGATSNGLAIARFSAGGGADPAFGINSDGRFESAFGNMYGAQGYDIVEDKQGRLVFAGIAFTSVSGDTQWLVDRVLSGGATDGTFHAGHAQQFTIVSTVGYAQGACCVALQSDGRIVVAGTMSRDGSFGHYYFAIARFNDTGSFDPTWGGGGQSYGDMSTQAPNVDTDMPNSLVITAGGIVVGGYTQIKSGEARFVAVKARTDLLLVADFE